MVAGSMLRVQPRLSHGATLPPLSAIPRPPGAYWLVGGTIASVPLPPVPPMLACSGAMPGDPAGWSWRSSRTPGAVLVYTGRHARWAATQVPVTFVAFDLLPPGSRWSSGNDCSAGSPTAVVRPVPSSGVRPYWARCVRPDTGPMGRSVGMACRARGKEAQGMALLSPTTPGLTIRGLPGRAGRGRLRLAAAAAVVAQLGDDRRTGMMLERDAVGHERPSMSGDGPSERCQTAPNSPGSRGIARTTLWAPNDQRQPPRRAAPPVGEAT